MAAIPTRLSAAPTTRKKTANAKEPMIPPRTGCSPPLPRSDERRRLGQGERLVRVRGARSSRVRAQRPQEHYNGRPHRHAKWEGPTSRRDHGAPIEEIDDRGLDAAGASAASMLSRTASRMMSWAGSIRSRQIAS